MSSVDQLIENLKSPNPDIKLTAIRTLTYKGSVAAPALPGLVLTLDDPDSEVRASGALALGEIGICTSEVLSALSNEVLSALSKGLQDLEDHVRYWSSVALKLLAPMEPNVMDLLARALDDKSRPVRHQAACALVRIIAKRYTKAISASESDTFMIGSWSDPCGRATSVLHSSYRMLSADDWDAMITDAVRDHSVVVRRAAAVALQARGVPSPSVCEELLRDTDEDVRELVTKAIAKTKRNPDGVLAKLCHDPDPFVRREAVLGLGEAETISDAEVVTLRNSLHDKEATVRSAATRALKKVTPIRPGVYPDLVKTAIMDTDEAVRDHAFQSLYHLRQPAANDEDTSSSVDMLRQGLRQGDSSVRLGCAKILSRLSPFSKVAIPELVKAAQENGDTGYWAITAIGRLGPEARDALPSLIGALERSDPVRRYAWAIALRRIGVFSPEIINALSRLLEDPSIETRFHAAEALHTGGVASPEVVGVLSGVLSDEDTNPEFRRRARLMLETQERRS